MKKRALVLSIDAMTGEDLKIAEEFPNFAALLSDCALATGVEAVFPSLTYPCHVAMATGCWPMNTGIVNNELFVPCELKRPWYFYTDQICRPTIFAAAAAAGISTGCVMWPCMGRGPIDTLVPEIWGESVDAPFLEPFCAAGSENFIRGIWGEVGGIAQGFRQPMFDEFVTAITEQVIRQKAPELLYVHICQVDNAKHYAGLGTPEVRRAIGNTDGLIGRLCAVLEEMGLRESTCVVLCSDHGQLPVKQISYPNRLLAAQGLLRGDGVKHISAWSAQVQSACLSALLYAADEAGAQRATALLRTRENRKALGIRAVLSRDEARRKYHVDGDFAAVLLGESGIYFDNSFGPGPLLEPVEASGLPYRANHGHDPALGESPFFLLSGPGTAAGVRIRTGARLIDEPVTIAAMMGFDLPGADGRPLRELLR